MNLLSASKTDVGRKRDHNEDYVWVYEPLGIYIVADGLGGYEAGEVASHMAATTIGQILTNELPHVLTQPDEIKRLLVNTLEKTNYAIYQAAQQNPQRQNMSTTVMVVVAVLPQIYICHAGDTRTYLLRHHTLTQLTTDDSWVTGSKLRHVLTKALGQEDPLEPEFIELTTQPDDLLILCSDGLWDMVKHELILSLCPPTYSPQECVEALVAAANQAGGHDNISTIVLRVVADS